MRRREEEELGPERERKRGLRQSCTPRKTLKLGPSTKVTILMPQNRPGKQENRRPKERTGTQKTRKRPCNLLITRVDEIEVEPYPKFSQATCL